MDSRPGDEMLLLAVAERDMGAFRTLYDRHAGWLAIRLARRCNDRDLVADAIQDTFVAVWHAVVLVLMAPSLVPQVARWVRAFPAPGASGPSSESRVVDRPRGVRGGHRCLDRWPKPAPVDVQCSVIPATTD